MRWLSRLRTRLRLRIWTWRCRWQLRHDGCDAEFDIGSNVYFHSLPTIELTRQGTGVERSGDERGSLRIDVGEWVHLGRDLTIEIDPRGRNALALAEGVSIGTAVRVVLFDGEAKVGAYTRVRDGVMLKSAGTLTIGEYGIVQNQTLIHCNRAVTIGDRANLAERVSMLDSDHGADGSDTWIQDQPLAVEPVELGRNVWVGANVVILRGVRLADNCVVAAGSVVRQGEYPVGWLVAGAPAEAKRPLSPAAGHS